MLSNIPTHLIAGPLGAGKTSLLLQLLAQCPADQRWAVLINEFGAVGLDAALLSSRQPGLHLAEVPGGCLCCANGLPFQVSLGRLLRRARPQRLFIEPSGLGHPQQLLQQLRAAPWQQVLALQPPVLVLDASAQARGEALPEAQQALLEQAGLLLLNKSAGLDQAQRQQLLAQLPANATHLFTDHGRLALDQLPGYRQQASSDPAVTLPSPGLLLRDPAPVRSQPWQISHSAEAWSIGWCWPASTRFDLKAVQRWLDGLPWLRAKLLLRGAHGWQTGNALTGAPLLLQPCRARPDARLELIFPQPQDPHALHAALLNCQLSPST